MQGCFWMSHTTETLAKAPKAICSQKSIYWKLLLNLSLFKTFFPLSQEWHSDQNGQTGNNNGKNGNICMSPDKQNRGTKEMKG